MSTFYGMKPIIGDGLKYFLHTLNIDGYTSGDFWEDSQDSGKVTLIVSNSIVETRGRKRYFNTVGSLDITSVDSRVLNPRTGSYSMTLWFQANSNNGFIFEQGNQFSLFLTGTNHLLMYVQPNFIATPYGIAVSGSYGFVTGNVSNNHVATLAFDADIMEIKHSKWSYAVGTTKNCTYTRGVAMDSASFLSIGLYDAWNQDYINNGYKTSAGLRMFRWNYVTPGDPAANLVWGWDIDFNDEFTYHANRSLTYNGLLGWICQRRKWGGNYADAAVTASHFYQPYGICIDKLPLSTGSFGYAVGASHELCKFEQDSMSIVLRTGSEGAGEHQFNLPYGVCCDQEYVYVADRDNYRIMKLDKQLRYIMHTGSSDTISEYYVRPLSISVNATHIFTTSYYDYKIKKFDKNTLEYVSEIQMGFLKDNGWYSYSPKSIWASGSYVYVSNRSDLWRIYKRTEHGNFTMLKTGTFSGAPALDDPWNCAMEEGYFFPEGATEPTGFMWFGNTDGDGHIKAKWDGWVLSSVTESWAGANNTGSSGWNSPMDFCLDKENRWLFGTDYNNYRIKKLDMDTMSTLAFTGSGVENGATQSSAPAQGTGDHEFYQPKGLTMSGSYIYVCDTYTHKIKRFNKDLEYIDETESNDPQHVLFDKNTNKFYIFDDGRYIRQYDHEWNQIGDTKIFPYGQEADQLIGLWAYGTRIDDKFIYNCDVWKNAIVIDKETLTWENELEAYKIVMRSKAIDTGSWHSMTYTWDGEDMKLYLDGEFQTSQSMANYAITTWNVDVQNTEPMRFGKWNWYNYTSKYVDTRIGALLVYGKVLNDEEIRKNYDSLKVEFTE